MSLIPSEKYHLNQCGDVDRLEVKSKQNAFLNLCYDVKQYMLNFLSHTDKIELMYECLLRDDRHLLIKLFYEMDPEVINLVKEKYSISLLHHICAPDRLDVPRDTFDWLLKLPELKILNAKCSCCGNTAAMMAARAGNLVLVSCLLKASARIETIRNKFGETALMLASVGENPTNAAIVTMLANTVSLQFLDIQDDDEETALMKAVKRGHSEVVKVLIGAGADPDIGDMEGHTSLMMAARAGNMDLVQILVNGAADMNILGSEVEYPALSFAISCEYPHVASYLIAQGCNVNPFEFDVTLDNNLSPMSPLMLAAEKGYENLVVALLPEGEVDYQDGEGCTALHIASFEGHTSVVETLIEFGASSHMLNYDGMSALMLAAMKGHCDTIVSLINCGCSIDDVNDETGDTALHCAAEAGKSGAVAILIAFGADMDVMNFGQQTAKDLASLHNHSKTVLVLSKVFTQFKKKAKLLNQKKAKLLNHLSSMKKLLTLT